MRSEISPFVRIGAILVLGGGFALFARAAASDPTIDLHAVPAASVYGGQPDVLGLDVTIRAPHGDVLDTFVVRQMGTAQWQRDILAATLWTDGGAEGFQGAGSDTAVASGTWVSSTNGWVFDRLGTTIPESGRRFFVTTTLYHTPADGTSIQLELPAYQDGARLMEFDPGDLGIFLRTARPAPETPLRNPNAHRIIRPVADSYPPVVRIVTPTTGAVIDHDWVIVHGTAVDVGGSAPAKVLVGINRVGHEITWVDATPEVALFATWEARFFGLPAGEQLEFRVQGEDWVGNRSAVSAPVTVQTK